jgi:hypothetical protein
MAIGRIPEPGTGIPESIIAAKGDLIVGTANDTPGILSVGTNGHTLVADSVETTGLKWVAPAGGGKVLQVVQGTLTATFSTTSTSLVDTGLTVSITPSSASSKVMVYASGYCISERSGSFANTASNFALLRGATQLQLINHAWYGSNNETNMELNATMAFSYLDSPATTSATTYKIQCAANTSNTTARVAGSANTIASIVVMEIGA